MTVVELLALLLVIVFPILYLLGNLLNSFFQIENTAHKKPVESPWYGYSPLHPSTLYERMKGLESEISTLSEQAAQLDKKIALLHKSDLTLKEQRLEINKFRKELNAKRRLVKSKASKVARLKKRLGIGRSETHPADFIETLRDKKTVKKRPNYTAWLIYFNIIHLIFGFFSVLDYLRLLFTNNLKTFRPNQPLIASKRRLYLSLKLSIQTKKARAVKRDLKISQKRIRRIEREHNKRSIKSILRTTRDYSLEIIIKGELQRELKHSLKLGLLEEKIKEYEQALEEYGDLVDVDTLFVEYFKDRRVEVFKQKELLSWISFSVFFVLLALLPGWLLSILMTALFLYRLPKIAEYYKVDIHPIHYIFTFILLTSNFYLMPLLELNYYLVFAVWAISFLVGVGKGNRIVKFLSFIVFFSISIQSFHYLDFLSLKGGDSFGLLFLTIGACFYFQGFLTEGLKTFKRKYILDHTVVVFLPSSAFTAYILSTQFELKLASIFVVMSFTHIFTLLFNRIGLPKFSLEPDELFFGERFVFGAAGALGRLDHLMIEIPLFCIGYFWLL